MASFHPPGLPCRLTLGLPIKIRTCVEDDLPMLEWFGQFAHHRDLIQRAYAAQGRGESVMLVAEANGFPVGQTWVDLTQKAAASTGLIWAVRVFAPLRRAGLGARLMAAAEPLIRGHGLRWAELGVERDNPDARRFYERLGYHQAGTQRGYYTYTTPDGMAVQAPLDLWVLRKDLRHARLPDADTGGAAANLPHALP